MKNRKILKVLATGALGAVMAFVGGSVANVHKPFDRRLTGTLNPTAIVSTTTAKISATREQVTLTEPLNGAIRKILHKSESETLYSDDFMLSPEFNPPKSEPNPTPSGSDNNNGSSEDETPTVTPQSVLNLSGTGVTDIRELAQFEFPSTLTTINLAGNGVTEKNIAGIQALLSLHTEDPISLSESDTSQGGSGESGESGNTSGSTSGSTSGGSTSGGTSGGSSGGTNTQGGSQNESQNSENANDENTIVSKTDFVSTIKLVNLNDNDIDLTKVADTALQNTKIFYGVQGLSKIDPSGLVRKGDVTLQYYIRQSDVALNGAGESSGHSDGGNFVLDFWYEFSTEQDAKIKLVYDSVSSILSDSFGKYRISLSGATDGFLSGYESKSEFTYFDIKLKDNFWVERKALLDLGILDGMVSSDSKLQLLDGSTTSHSLRVSYRNASTNIATRTDPENAYTNYVNITVTDPESGLSRTVPVEFLVKDTIAPVIVLKGNTTMYISRNRTFVDPGATAYDPAFKGATDGDPISYSTSGTIDVSVLGSNVITYTAFDGFNTTKVTRTVIVVETAFDNVILRMENVSENIAVGDDLRITVQPDSSIDMSKFKNVSYDWYLDDTLFISTTADEKGFSSITYNPQSTGTLRFYVKAHATQVSDGARIDIFSADLLIKVTAPITQNDALIIAVACAVLLIIITIAIVTIHKITKAKKNITGKKQKPAKHSTKGSSDNGSTTVTTDIKVIRDYTGGNGQNYDPNQNDKSNGASTQQGGGNSTPPKSSGTAYVDPPQNRPHSQSNPFSAPPQRPQMPNQAQNPQGGGGTPIAKIQPIKMPTSQLNPNDVNPNPFAPKPNNNNKK